VVLVREEHGAIHMLHADAAEWEAACRGQHGGLKEVSIIAGIEDQGLRRSQGQGGGKATNADLITLKKGR
jgi:hypothetical protein